MLYPVNDFLELLIAMFLTLAPILFVVWLVFAVLGAFRSDSPQREHGDTRAWDHGREIGRLEGEIADLRRRIADLERRQQPSTGD